MLTYFVASPAFLLSLLTCSVVSALATVLAVFQFEQQRRRLDPATRLHDVRERLAVKRDELDRKEAEIAEANKKLELRDRVIAETAALEERLFALRLELAGLSDARQQIETTKQAAADAATELATQQDKLAATRVDLEAAAEELKGKKADYDRIAAKMESHEHQLALLETELPKQIEELQTARNRLEEELQAKRGELGMLAAVRTEIAEVTARKEGLARELEAAREAIVTAKMERDEVVVELSTTTDELDDTKRSLDAVNLELQSRQTRHRDISEQVNSLEIRKALLEQQIVDNTGSSVNKTENDPIEDLKILPTFLQGPVLAARELEKESDALQEVSAYLKKLKLTYDPRTVHAFHTALKINDTSQLTVLAGVSGTGKSLLPRRYAEAMGLGFLPISVEPRWDSPQDLLGFYNYIEKRYRATDLARSLVQLDPYKTSGLANDNYTDRMVLVLLDEMNLARVEYYFSEFLSRLEIRPPYTPVNPNDADISRRRDSWISIDIRGIKDGSIKLFPPHNMLFVGTMNDDESTQSLSDKVLDRSNIMQFTAPEEFKKYAQSVEPKIETRPRSFAQWRAWIRTTDRLQGAADDKSRQVIRELARIMEDCGRPFGHRLNASILAYAANYPDHGHQNDGLDMALADQIEFRILPKLRGLRIEEHEKTFQKLEGLVARELNDQPFAERLKVVVENQRGAGGLFNWRGLARNTDGR